MNMNDAFDNRPQPVDSQSGIDPRQFALQSAYNFAQRTGRANVLNRLTNKLNNRGYGVDPTMGADFNSPDLDTVAANKARPVLNRIAVNQGRQPIRPDVFGARTNAIADENWYNQVADPALSQAQGQVESLLRSPTFSPEYRMNARSQIASTIKGAAQRNLRSVAATLGLRGMDASSPASQAIAARSEIEADRALSGSLSNFDLQVDDLERGDTAREASLLDSLVAQRAAIRAGGRESGKELTALLGALRQQHDAEEAARAAARSAGGTDYLSAGLGLAGAALGGPLGAQIGSGIGSMFSKPNPATHNLGGGGGMYEPDYFQYG